MLDRDIIDQIQAAETSRIDATMAETSPAAVVARMEREQTPTYRALLTAIGRATTWAQ